MRTLLIVAALMASTSAQAGTVLWGKVEAGMARSAVEATYPGWKKVFLTKDAIRLHGEVINIGECKTDPVVLFKPDGTVKSVAVDVHHSCTSAAATALVGRYGGSAIDGPLSKHMVWREGEKTITFEPGRPYGLITYETSQTSGL